MREVVSLAHRKAVLVVFLEPCLMQLAFLEVLVAM